MIPTLPVDRVDELTLHGPFLYTSLPFLHLTSPRCPERSTPRFERDQLYITHLRQRKTASPTFLNHHYVPSNQSPAYIAPSSTLSSIANQLSSLSHFAMHGRRNAVSIPPSSPTGFVAGRGEPLVPLHSGSMKHSCLPTFESNGSVQPHPFYLEGNPQRRGPRVFTVLPTRRMALVLLSSQP